MPKIFVLSYTRKCLYWRPQAQVIQPWDGLHRKHRFQLHGVEQAIAYQREIFQLSCHNIPIEFIAIIMAYIMTKSHTPRSNSELVIAIIPIAKPSCGRYFVVLYSRKKSLLIVPHNHCLEWHQCRSLSMYSRIRHVVATACRRCAKV